MPATVQVLRPREVPLGGPRAMTVRRTLPHRSRSFVGAWCFLDHYGPDDVTRTGGMDVPPHPHTGLATVSLLFEGEVEHRDTLGTHALVRPGEVNLMTAGHGIAHSEVSTPTTSVLHGVQLWLASPDTVRDGPRVFENYAAPVLEVAPGVRARVYIGSLAGYAAPVATATPLLAAEIDLAPGATWTIPADPRHEHAVLADTVPVTLEDTVLAPGELGVVDAGPPALTVRAEDIPARLLLLGGEPFEEEIVMWWNFIARSDAELRTMREQWQDDVARGERYGMVAGYTGDVDWLPAPQIPAVRLRPRGRLGHR